jgi:hypothetical protein
MGIASDVRAAINETFGDIYGDIPTYDYWISRLYTPEGNLNIRNWTEENLAEMKADAAALASLSK